MISYEVQKAFEQCELKEKPEALRLADALNAVKDHKLANDSAKELTRLHLAHEELMNASKDLIVRLVGIELPMCYYENFMSTVTKLIKDQK